MAYSEIISVGIIAICSRPEVANDDISGYMDDTFREYHVANLSVTSVVLEVFQKIVIDHLCNALITMRLFGPHFCSQEARMSNDLHKSN